MALIARHNRRVVMKRYIVIFSCLSVFYAGAVWAYEGCRNLVGDGTPHHRAEKTVLPPPQDSSPSHHKHSDPGKIHCLSFFGEFVLSSRATINPAGGLVGYVAWDAIELNADVIGAMPCQWVHGPPFAGGAKSFPRYLIHSVLRI